MLDKPNIVTSICKGIQDYLMKVGIQMNTDRQVFVAAMVLDDLTPIPISTLDSSIEFWCKRLSTHS